MKKDRQADRQAGDWKINTTWCEKSVSHWMDVENYIRAYILCVFSIASTSVFDKILETQVHPLVQLMVIFEELLTNTEENGMIKWRPGGRTKNSMYREPIMWIERCRSVRWSWDWPGDRDWQVEPDSSMCDLSCLGDTEFIRPESSNCLLEKWAVASFWLCIALQHVISTHLSHTSA